MPEDLMNCHSENLADVEKGEKIQNEANCISDKTLGSIFGHSIYRPLDCPPASTARNSELPISPPLRRLMNQARASVGNVAEATTRPPCVRNAAGSSFHVMLPVYAVSWVQIRTARSIGLADENSTSTVLSAGPGWPKHDVNLESLPCFSLCLGLFLFVGRSLLFGDGRLGVLLRLLPVGFCVIRF